jgi:predicted  nucleic acid-binding Zn-ribbon protein
MSVPASLARELHRLHKQLSDLKDRAERGPKQIRARETNLTRLTEELAREQTETRSAKMRADQKQLLLKSCEEKIEKHKGQLNACQSNREYQALKDQIAADQKACEVLSDEILDSFERVDEHKKLVELAEQNIKAATDDLAKLNEQVQTQLVQLTAEIRRVETELGTLEQNLPDDIRELYIRITRAKGYDAMAEVQDGISCGGCMQRLTPNLMSVLSSAQAVICKNCGRMIYLPESNSPVT